MKIGRSDKRPRASDANPYTYKLVEDFNWNFDDTHENNAESIFELLIEDVGGTDLWGDGENINSTQSIPALKNLLLKSEDGMKQILPSKLWISSGRKKTKTAILIIVPAVLWHGTMRDALTTKDLSGKFLHKTSGKHTGF